MLRRRRTGSWAATGSPSTRTSPALASTIRLISLSVVLLPQPEVPIRQSSSPSATVKETSLTASTRSPAGLW